MDRLLVLGIFFVLGAAEINMNSKWLGATHVKSSDFERLLHTLNFRYLITAHGEPLLNTAYEQVTVTFGRVFLS